jgi:hypothetical protein
MDRYLTHPKNLNWNDLQNNDWDVIELDITFNAPALLDWCNIVMENNKDSIWSFDRDDLVDHGFLEEFLKQREKLLVKTNTSIPEQWTLQWSYQREGVLPFMLLACKKQYPEVTSPNFLNEWNQNLDKYFFGWYKKYYEIFGPECFTVTRLVRFPKDCGLNTHRDTGDNQPFLIRMHAIPQISKEIFLNFGEDLTDKSRQYKLESGKIYLFNTGIPHAAINHSEIDWIMLHNNPTENAVNKLLKTRMYIE